MAVRLPGLPVDLALGGRGLTLRALQGAKVAAFALIDRQSCPAEPFLVVFARAAGVLAERGSGATDLVTSLFGVQLLTVPIGLLIPGWGLRLSRAGEWVLLFLVGIPIVIVVTFFGQFQMCGLVGEHC